jgi:hypothetical protein
LPTAVLDFRSEGNKYLRARRLSSMKREPSWWRLHQVRHRDAVVLALISAACLLASEIAESAIPNLYELYIARYLNRPPILVLVIVLLILGFTTYFGGIFVLLGGIHFSWGRVGRGRFLVGLGLGVGLLGLVSRLAKAILSIGESTGEPFGDPVVALFTVSTTVTGLLGILFGIASHTLMGRYALMLKKHAKRALRRWRKARRPTSKS